MLTILNTDKNYDAYIIPAIITIIRQSDIEQTVDNSGNKYQSSIDTLS